MTTLILTSTVNVDLNKWYLHQKDANDRLNTYIKSILQWLNNTNFNIVLVENSGYEYQELDNETKLFADRFEVISFKENEQEYALYLHTNPSKGASEIFAIDYAYRHSKLIQSSIFVIKITARYFIPELEEYLSQFNLNEYGCLTQNCRDRCEMVGSHIRNFHDIFYIQLLNADGYWSYHIEDIWKMRTSKYDNCLVCKEFSIEPTQRGGAVDCFVTI
jgi:hypothetical protein